MEWVSVDMTKQAYILRMQYRDVEFLRNLVKRNIADLSCFRNLNDSLPYAQFMLEALERLLRENPGMEICVDGQLEPWEEAGLAALDEELASLAAAEPIITHQEVEPPAIKQPRKKPRKPCPVCNRNFKNLGNHLRLAHPDYEAVPKEGFEPLKSIGEVGEE